MRKKLIGVAAVAVFAFGFGFLVQEHRAEAADATATTLGNDATGPQLSISMTATVRGRVRVTLTCVGTEGGYSATDGGGADAMTLAFGDVDAVPDSDPDTTGPVYKHRVDGESGAYWFADCTLTTRVTGNLGATPVLQANIGGADTMDVRLSLLSTVSTKFTANTFASSDTMDVSSTQATLGGGIATNPGNGTTNQSIGVGLFVADATADATAQSATLTVTFDPTP